MNESRIETAIGMCVVSLTKHIMQKEELDYESSYKKLLTTELYKLLGLFFLARRNISPNPKI